MTLSETPLLRDTVFQTPAVTSIFREVGMGFGAALTSEFAGSGGADGSTTGDSKLSVE